MPSLENQWVYCVVYGSIGERLLTSDCHPLSCITEETIRAWVMTPPKVISLGPLEGLQIAQRVRAPPLSSNCYLLCFFYFLILTGIPSLSRREENRYTNPDCGEVQIVYPGFEHSPFTCEVHDLQIMLCLAKKAMYAISTTAWQNTYILKLACSIGK